MIQKPTRTQDGQTAGAAGRTIRRHVGHAIVSGTQPVGEDTGALWQDTSSNAPSTSVVGITEIDSTDSPYTVTDSDTMIIADAASGAITVNLPSIVGELGRTLIVKKIDNVNIVTVDADGSETIDGAATQVISTQYDAVGLTAYSVEWAIN